MKTQRLTPILLSVVVLIGCQSSNDSIHVPTATEAQLLGRPQPLAITGNYSQLLLSDYVMDSEKIDSITTDGPFELTQHLDTLTIHGTFEFPMHALHFWTEGVRESILIKKQTKKEVTFRYDRPAVEVQIKGEFNAWNPASASMIKQPDGSFSLDLFIAEGNYQYLFVVDGEEVPDPDNSETVSNGTGGTNSVLNIPVTPKEKIPSLTTESVVSNKITLRSSLPHSRVYALWDQYLLPTDAIRSEADRLMITIPESANALVRSHLRIYACNELGVSNEVLVPLHRGQVIRSSSKLSRSDYESMVMYFLLVDRFANADTTNDAPLNDPGVHPKADFFGGDIQGVTQKLRAGYFEELGINTIWLSPISLNPQGAFGKYPSPPTAFSAYHGYWPLSSISVDPRFGGNQALADLVDLAHEKDYNVLLDYVANHVHEQHPIYQEHPDWATNLYLPDGTLNTQKWDEQRLTTWFDTFLPTLDLSRPEVAEPLTDSALFWLDRFDIDGFRHDATKHIDKLFWRILTRKIKEKHITRGKPVFQIGETYGSPDLIKSYINPGMLDGQFDFNLYDQAVQSFGNPDANFEGLLNALDKSLKYFGNHHLMGNITGNQDRPRFISLADGSLRFDEDHKYAGWNRNIQIKDPVGYKRLQMLTAFMMSIPGIPCLYYGDEYGSPGGNDPDNRRQMLFKNLDDQQQETREITKKLIQLRRNNLALLYGDTRVIPTSNEQTLLIERSYFDEKVLAVFNTSNTSQTLSIPDGGTSQFKNSTESGRLILPPLSFDLITY